MTFWMGNFATAEVLPTWPKYVFHTKVYYHLDSHVVLTRLQSISHCGGIIDAYYGHGRSYIGTFGP